MKISKRLELIESLVPFGARVCDIGTDHGYLSIALVKNGGVEKMISTDINEKPLERARKNIEKAGIRNIDIRLCDGLSGIAPEEVDTVIIAGMGGEVIVGILERGEAVTKRDGVEEVLQPTTSPEVLRAFLFENGYEIIEEIPVYENRKLYSVMRCRYTGKVIRNEVYMNFIGKVSPICEEGRLYIKKQYERCIKCERALKNIEEKQTEYNYYKEITDKLEEVLKSVKE